MILKEFTRDEGEKVEFVMGFLLSLLRALGVEMFFLELVGAVEGVAHSLLLAVFNAILIFHILANLVEGFLLLVDAVFAAILLPADLLAHHREMLIQHVNVGEAAVEHHSLSEFKHIHCFALSGRRVGVLISHVAHA